MRRGKHIKGTGTTTSDLNKIMEHKCGVCKHNKAVMIVRCKYLCERCSSKS